MDTVFHAPSPAPRFLPSVRALALLTLGVGIGVTATLPFTGDGSGLAVIAIVAATASAALAALKPKNPVVLGAALVMLGLALIATVFGRLGLPDAPGPLLAHADRWRPWRAYAVMRLWRAAAAGG